MDESRRMSYEFNTLAQRLSVIIGELRLRVRGGIVMI